MADIGVGELDTLRDDFTGVVGQAGESSYDDAVNIWNGAITRRPALVASCASSSDVAAALAFAQRQGLEVSVRGGGDNYAGFALCDDGLMIDLTVMNSVSVDVAGRRARCGGGATWGVLTQQPRLMAWQCRAGSSAHGGRGIDSGRRIRLAHPSGRPVVRQPGGSRSGHCRRAGAPHVGVGESGSVLGPPGWRRQLGVVTEFNSAFIPWDRCCSWACSCSARTRRGPLPLRP